MRQSTMTKPPSLVSDLGSLAGLYRTVFWMIGRTAQYGRIWPPEVDIVEEEGDGTARNQPMIMLEALHAPPVEAGVLE